MNIGEAAARSGVACRIQPGAVRDGTGDVLGFLPGAREIDDAQRADRPLDREERDWITLCISVAKAVQE